MEAIKLESMTDSYRIKFQGVNGYVRKTRKLVKGSWKHVFVFIELESEITEEFLKLFCKDIYHAGCKIYHQFHSGEKTLISDLTRYFTDYYERENA